eukprot:6794365-Prymnesium_polylepis.1
MQVVAHHHGAMGAARPTIASMSCSEDAPLEKYASMGGRADGVDAGCRLDSAVTAAGAARRGPC